eukprot:TRINITY_DN497_c0_g1_i1.p1 TRINITY_DN497_c0_g1~~TRINITY_DN497_c0_g1_i1.p1  ORF type:complete len:224 (-),score=66.42 TRINITY_DN497_c0_g1_i1:282-953(-)
MIQQNAFFRQYANSLYSPLHRAVESGADHDTIESMLKSCAGDGINDTTPEGQTALHLGVASQHTDAVRLLLRYGAFPNCRDEEGDTPLHYAVREDAVAEVRALVAHPGVHVDAPNDDGETPLHLAATFGAAALCKLLLKHKASMHARDAQGHTPAECALEGGHAALAMLLGLQSQKGAFVGHGTASFARPKMHLQSAAKPALAAGFSPDVLFNIRRLRLGQCN